MCNISPKPDGRDYATEEALAAIPGGTKYDYSGDLYYNPGSAYVSHGKRGLLGTSRYYLDDYFLGDLDKFYGDNAVGYDMYAHPDLQDSIKEYQGFMMEYGSHINPWGYEEPTVITLGDSRNARHAKQLYDAAMGNFLGLGEYADRYFGSQDWRAEYNRYYEENWASLIEGVSSRKLAQTMAMADLDTMKAIGFNDPYGLEVLQWRVNAGIASNKADKAAHKASDWEAIGAGLSFLGIISAGLSLSNFLGNLGKATVGEAVAANAGGLGFKVTTSAGNAFASGINLANAGTIGAATGGLGLQLTPAAIAAFESGITLGAAAGSTWGVYEGTNLGGQGLKLTDSALAAFNSGMNLPMLLNQNVDGTWSVIKDGVRTGLEIYGSATSAARVLEGASAMRDAAGGAEGMGRSFRTQPGDAPGVRGKRKHQLAGLNINLGYGDAGPSLVVPEKSRY